MGRLSSKMFTWPRRGAGRAAVIGAPVGEQGADLFFPEMVRVRLDKFMKVSRLSKRRSEAHEALVHGRITKDGRPLKPGYEVHPGDVLVIHYATKYVTVRVREVPLRMTPGVKPAELYEIFSQSADDA
jgi:ribosomal 50S subunit-recycling heat shock protein